MRVTSELLDGDVAGSGAADRIVVHAWRGGQLLVSDLPVRSFSLGWDDSRQVQGQASFTFADPGGSLAPRSLDGALAPFGSQLQVTWVSGASGIEVPLGWWRIRSTDPTEQWVVRRNAAGERVPVPGGGGVVEVAADELLCIPASLDRLDAETVPAGATCLGEVERLLEGIMPVDVDDAIEDKPVPASLVYEEGRMDAVEDHLGRVGARYRMGPGGELEVVPEAGVGPVWTVEGGESGALISLGRSYSDQSVYNAAVSTSQTDDGEQLVGRAYRDEGPLAYEGPFGRVIIFHQAIATTQSGVEADARTLLANRHQTSEVPLSVACLLHPGLQINDIVTLIAPSSQGMVELPGRVAAMSMAGTDGYVSKNSSLTVMVTSDRLDAVRGGRG